jgi:transketolase
MSKTLLEKLDAAYPEFANEVNGLAVQDLKNRIAAYQKELQESEEHRESNEPLAEAKAEVKELSGGYNDVRKAVKLKTKYLISLIKEKGGQ